MADALLQRLDATGAILSALARGRCLQAERSEKDALLALVVRDGVPGNLVSAVVGKIKALPLSATAEEELILAVAENIRSTTSGPPSAGAPLPAALQPLGAAAPRGAEQGQDYTAIVNYIPQKVHLLL